MVAALLALCVAMPGLSRAATAATPSGPDGGSSSSSELFTFADAAIAESSGIAPSSFDDTFYTHNDSGDAARFFRVDANGQTVAVYTLRGAANIDWEDMATGASPDGAPLLYFADIGDNTRSRKTIDVYQVPEPRGGSGDVAWVRYSFVYPDGAHDAEAFLVDPRSHRMYIATKELLGHGELYGAPATLSTSTVNPLTPVRSVPALTTSGAFSPDGARIVLLTYLNAYWADGVTGDLHSFAVPLQKQNEAIAFTRDGGSVIVGSEGEHSAVYRVPFPADAPASAQPVDSSAPTTTTSDAASRTPNSGPSWPLIVVAVFLGALVIVAALVVAAWRRRPR